MQANGLNGNLIYPGQSLTIPGASGGQGGGQGGTPTATENGTTDYSLCNHLLEHCLPNFQRSTNKC